MIDVVAGMKCSTMQGLWLPESHGVHQPSEITINYLNDSRPRWRRRR